MDDSTEVLTSCGTTSGRPLPTGFVGLNELLSLLLDPPVSPLPHIPFGVKENVGFLIDNSCNIAQHQKNQRREFYDDCGAWSKGSSPKTFLVKDETSLQHVTYNRDLSVYCIPKSIKGVRQYVPMDPQPDPSSIIELQRNYSVSAASPSYQRRVTWINSFGMQAIKPVAFVEYVGTFPGDRPHGNSKNKDSVYLRSRGNGRDKVSPATYDQRRSEAYYPLKRDLSRDSKMTSTQKKVTGERYNDVLQCTSCHTVFKTKKQLLKHIKDKPFQCAECGKCFRSVEGVLLHTKVHTGERQYECGECEMLFVRRGELHRHMKIHTGEKPHSCNKCFRKFARHDYLVKHMKSHV